MSRLITASSEWVVTHGRHLWEEENGVLFDWPNTGVSFAVRGTDHVAIRLSGGRNDFSYKISCDGTILKESTINTPARCQDIVLANQLPENAQVDIEIRKRTEAPGGQAIKSPAVTAKRKIEFIGDSDTAAFGVLGNKTSVTNFFSINKHNQDASKSWADHVATAFQADYHNISFSGIGAVYNAALEKRNMQQYYLQTLVNDASALARPGEAFDLVVVYLGGNDWYSVGKKKSLEEPFITGYSDFLQTVRASRPDSPILVLRADKRSGSSLGTVREQEKFSNDMERLLTKACAKAGGEANKIYLRLVDLDGAISLSDDADWGNIMHWSTVGHRKWAKGVIPLVAELTGWQYSVGK